LLSFKNRRNARAYVIIDHLVRIGPNRNPAEEMSVYRMTDLEWAFELLSGHIAPVVPYHTGFDVKDCKADETLARSYSNDVLVPLLLPLYFTIKQLQNRAQRETLERLREVRHESAPSSQPKITDPSLLDPVSNMRALISIRVMEEQLAENRIACSKLDECAASGEKPESVEVYWTCPVFVDTELSRFS